MELFPPLTMFFEAIETDVRVGTTHISLYMALLQQWNLNGGKNPVSINRVPIMRAAKINARYTYYKCINDLHDYGYISYLPSSNPLCKSFVSLLGLKQ